MNEAMRDKVLKAANSACIHPCYCDLVDKINNANGKPAQRILLIADSQIAFWKTGRNPSMSRTYYWYSFSSISISEQTLQLDFDGLEPMKFKSNDMEKIKDVIGRILLRTLPKYQIEKVNIESLTQTSPSINGLSLQARFLSYAMMNELKVPDSILVHVTDIFKYRRQVAIFEQSDHIGLLLGAFIIAAEISDFIKSLILPYMKNDPYNYISYIFDGSPIENILIRNKPNNKFPEFCLGLSESANNNLTSIGFADVDFSEKQLELLHNAIVGKEIKTVTLNNAFSPKKNSYFISNFLDAPLFKSVRMINLDRTISLDLSPLFQKINGLSVLSLVDCKLEIAEVLTKVGENGLDRLRLLNLSGNNCNIQLDGVEFGENINLMRLDLSKVKWNEGTFPSLFRWILRQKFESGLMLDVSDAETSELSYQKALSTMKSSSTLPFTFINWSGNPVSRDFISIIEKCKFIFSLSISRCFSESDSSLLAELATSISKSKTLLYLEMRGGKKFTGEAMSSFLDSLKTTNLVHLDLRYQKMGQPGITAFQNLCKRAKSVTRIAFDGSGILNIRSLRDFFTELSQLERLIEVDWPAEDLVQIMNKETITGADITELKRILSTIYIEQCAKVFCPDLSRKDDYFERPYDSFQITEPSEFPLYLNKSIEYSIDHPSALASNLSDDNYGEVSSNDDYKGDKKESKRSDKKAKKPTEKLRSPKKDKEPKEKDRDKRNRREDKVPKAKENHHHHRDKKDEPKAQPQPQPQPQAKPQQPYPYPYPYAMPYPQPYPYPYPPPYPYPMQMPVQMPMAMPYPPPYGMPLGPYPPYRDDLGAEEVKRPRIRREAPRIDEDSVAPQTPRREAPLRPKPKGEADWTLPSAIPSLPQEIDCEEAISTLEEKYSFKALALELINE